jgi:hypothetical protein
MSGILSAEIALAARIMTFMPYPPSTLLHLESKFADLATLDPQVLRAAFLMGLQYPGPYWIERSIAWAEQGFVLDDDAVLELKRIAASSPKQLPQAIRHRAMTLVSSISR